LNYHGKYRYFLKRLKYFSDFFNKFVVISVYCNYKRTGIKPTVAPSYFHSQSLRLPIKSSESFYHLHRRFRQFTRLIGTHLCTCTGSFQLIGIHMCTCTGLFRLIGSRLCTCTCSFRLIGSRLCTCTGSFRLIGSRLCTCTCSFRLFGSRLCTCTGSFRLIGIHMCTCTGLFRKVLPPPQIFAGSIKLKIIAVLILLLIKLFHQIIN
jgi:hypothetical protein